MRSVFQYVVPSPRYPEILLGFPTDGNLGSMCVLHEKGRERESMTKREHRFQSKPQRIVELCGLGGDNRWSATENDRRHWSCMLMSADPTIRDLLASDAISSIPWPYLTTPRVALTIYYLTHSLHCLPVRIGADVVMVRGSAAKGVVVWSSMAWTPAKISLK